MDTISKAWDWQKNTDDFWHEPSEISYYLIARWKRNNFTRFLDLGCGLGRHSILFAENGFSVDAIDFSDTAVNEVKNKCIKKNIYINVIQGDMLNLPYKNCTFDCLLAYHVISHTDSKGILKILSEINRVLTTNGEFYLSLCSKKSWSYQKAGYPQYDENTVIKNDSGPEQGIPHFYSDEITIKEIFKNNRILSNQHIQDIVVHGKELKDSWHYFILGKKDA